MLARMPGRFGISGAAAGAALWLALASAPVARADDAAPPKDAPSADQPAQLDRLLTLPGGQNYGVDRRGGLSRGEWRTRFVEVQASTQRSIVAAHYSGRNGAPALFLREHFGALTNLTGEEGARALLNQNSGRVASIDLPEFAVDLDRPEDYAALKS